MLTSKVAVNRCGFFLTSVLTREGLFSCYNSNAMSENLSQETGTYILSAPSKLTKFFQSIDSINITVKCCCYCCVQELGVKESKRNKYMYMYSNQTKQNGNFQ